MGSLYMSEVIPVDPDTAFSLAVQIVKRWRFCRIEGLDGSRRVISFNAWLTWRSLLSPFLQGSPDMTIAVEPAEAGGSLVTLTSEPYQSSFTTSLQRWQAGSLGRHIYGELHEEAAQLHGQPPEVT